MQFAWLERSAGFGEVSKEVMFYQPYVDMAPLKAPPSFLPIRGSKTFGCGPYQGGHAEVGGRTVRGAAECLGTHRR